MDLKTFLENFDAIAEAPGGIPKLRSLILDLAVRGKLVPQNPEDEPAQVFLKRALEARKDWYATACRLAEVNGSKKPRTPCLLMPQLLLTDYPYTVPRTWTFCFFENLAAAKEYAIKAGPFGSALKKQDYTERGYKIYGQEQVIKNDALFGDYYIGEEKYQQLKSCSVEPGDLLISLVGTIGKTLTLVEGCEPGIINPRLVKISLHSEINRRFIQIYLMSPEAMHLMKENAHGGTMDILNLKILSDLSIALPPLAEQKRIVEKVDELMGLCDRYEAAKQTRDNLRQKLRGSAINSLMNAETDEELDAAWAIVRDNWYNLSQHPEDVDGLRKSVLQLAIRGELVPQHPNDEPASDLLKKLKFEKEQLLQEKRFLKSEKLAPINLEDLSYNIPEEWALTRIGVVCGSIVPNRDKPKTFSGGFPWVTLSNFDEKSIKLRNNHSGIGLSKEEVVEFNARIIPNRSILMSCVGRFGLVAVLERDVVTNQQIHGFVIPNGLYPEYVAYVIKAHTEFLESTATSTTVAYLNKTRCESIPFPLPPLAEQKRIVAKVDELMQLCDQLEASLRQSQQRAEALAASAISHLTI